jgi:hypothetical protein
MDLPASAYPRCLACDRPITRPDGPLVLTEVVGYTRPRSQGGANHIIGRRATGRFLCEACSLRVPDPKLSPDQLELT